MQGRNSRLSIRHSKLAPGSEVKNVFTFTFFCLVLTVFFGRLTIVVSGGVVSGGPDVSTVKLRLAGD